MEVDSKGHVMQSEWHLMCGNWNCLQLWSSKVERWSGCKRMYKFGGKLLRFVVCSVSLVSDRLNRNETKTVSIAIDSEGNSKTLLTEKCS